MTHDVPGKPGGSNSIVAVAFDPAAHAELVRDFSCGDEPYERDRATWIQSEAAETIARGGNVWLYVTENRDVIGFGSLAVSRWNYPEPANRRVALALIPAVAVQKQFWGKPDGPRDNRYSSQILDDLILTAAQLKLDAPILGLFVHPENQRAIKAYERAGFIMFSKTYIDKATNVEYRSMIRRLAMAN